MDDQDNGWMQYQKLVLAELERHTTQLQMINAELGVLKVELAMLKVKSGVWGLAGGLIPVIIALALERVGK